MNEVILNNGRIRLIHGDCLEIMPQLPAQSIDMVLADLPYGTTACKWDIIIPLDKLWKNYNRIAVKKAAMVFTSSQPFTSVLVHSNLQHFKYDIIWDKQIAGGMSYARYQPMRQHETICVFYRKTSIFNAQKTKRDKPIKEGGKAIKSESAPIANFNSLGNKVYHYKNPTSIVSYRKLRKGTQHPTQKPVALIEYLIRTYTHENMIVLDNVMGSGTTGVACINTNRQFIGIEKDAKYFEIAVQRCKEALENGITDKIK